MINAPDKKQVRRAFARAAVFANGAAAAAEEPMDVIARRLLSRLDEIDLAPAVMADIGGGGCPMLAQRFGAAKMLALDFALPVLRRAAKFNNGDGGGGILRVQADAEQLPVADGSVDLAYSNLCLEWTDAGATVSEAARILREGGVFLFSTLGPDTLREMREAFGGRVHHFADMHDIGDLLPPRGFAEPVMEREEIRLTYAKAEDAAREVHRWGASYANQERAQGLTGKNKWRAFLSAYPRDNGGEGCAATYEVIYALAWRAKDKDARADAPMKFFPRMPGRERRQT